MKNHEHLTTHPLVEQSFQHITPVLEKLSPELAKRAQGKGRIRNKAITVLENSDHYHVMVFQKASALISAIERLENSVTYIDRFPSPRAFEKKGIQQFSWLEYHYSYFVVTYDSLLDIALILTNSVFQLGISEKDCKPQMIKGNAWVKNTSVKPALDALGQVTLGYREIRNLFVHRGDILDISSVTESDILELLKVHSTVYRHSEPLVPTDIIDSIYKYESKKIISKIGDDVLKARKAVTKLFDCLLPIYKKKSHSLKIAT